ncbi:relaxase/mobilization nuclease domain-containing protein [Pedobacter sp.]
MVAKISQGTSLNRMISYNEIKVGKGVAVCIAAGNYPFDPERMGFSLKLEGMQRQAELNHRAGLKAMHISLNFSPSETGLTKEKLTEIADRYMQGIGFGEQPYLVYQHYDAAHPHIHIVTTTVRRDSSHINTYLIGKRKSEPARKAIEEEFGLVRAQDQDTAQQYRQEPISAKVVEYGKLETKKAIQNVLVNILPKYKYASLAELNAVLGLYNIRADRGGEDSRVYQRGGLLYRLLDAEQKPIGVPIKASSFYNKPTLSNLREYFDGNREKSIASKSRVRMAVDMAFKSPVTSLEELQKALATNQISLVMRRSEQGLVYGLTYVDHAGKCVLNGSELGKPYSAKMVQERCMESRLEAGGVNIEQLREVSHKIDAKAANVDTTSSAFNWTSASTAPSFFTDLLDCLIRIEYTPEYIPYELRQQKKKKRKKRRNIYR